MPWDRTPASRRQADAEFYADPRYRASRALARRRAGGRCEECGHRHDRLQCDHIIPHSQGGGHELANLMMRCAGEGTCKCHEKKTAQEGGGFRKPGGDSQPRPPRPRRDPAPKRPTKW